MPHYTDPNPNVAGVETRHNPAKIVDSKRITTRVKCGAAIMFKDGQYGLFNDPAGKFFGVAMRNYAALLKDNIKGFEWEADQLADIFRGPGSIAVLSASAVNEGDDVRVRLYDDATQGVQLWPTTTPKLLTDPTGLVGVTNYKALANVGGVLKAITFAGSAAPTYGALITEINNDLGATIAKVELTTAGLLFTNLATGSGSTIRISNDPAITPPTVNLFTALTGAAPDPEAAVDGLDNVSDDVEPGYFTNEVMAGKTVLLKSCRFKGTTTAPGIAEIEIGTAVEVEPD